MSNANEPDRINNGALAMMVALVTLATLGIALYVTSLVRSEVRQLGSARQQTQERGIRDLRAEQLGKLSGSPSWVDSANGVVSMPIDSAMSSVVEAVRRNPMALSPWVKPPKADETEGSVPEGSVPEGSVPEGSVPEGEAPAGSAAEDGVPTGRATPVDEEAKGAAAQDGLGSPNVVHRGAAPPSGVSAASPAPQVAPAPVQPAPSKSTASQGDPAPAKTGPGTASSLPAPN